VKSKRITYLNTTENLVLKILNNEHVSPAKRTNSTHLPRFIIKLEEEVFSAVGICLTDEGVQEGLCILLVQVKERKKEQSPVDFSPKQPKPHY
jgi:hypothetical protein